jgi:hypothetical protein
MSPPSRSALRRYRDPLGRVVPDQALDVDARLAVRLGQELDGFDDPARRARAYGRQAMPAAAVRTAG